VTDEKEFSNGVANEAKEALLRTGEHYQRLMVTIVSLVSVVGLILIVVIVVAVLRLQQYAQTNTRLGRQNAQLLKAQEANNEFGIKAVECILANFAEHRYTNQEVHDGIAKALGIPMTPHTPLPQRFTPEEFTKVCGPFGGRP
jgi:hypothetical protein